jgi:hypothetical protein
VCQEHRALRMPLCEQHQFVDRAPGVQSIGAQQRLDVTTRLHHRQSRQLQRPRLAVERSLVIGKQSTHQRGLTTGEHIRRGLAVMLDHRSNQAVERVIGDQQVLELVHAHNRQATADLMQAERDVKQLEQGNARFVGGRPAGRRSKPHLQPGYTSAHAQPRHPAPNAATRVRGQRAERLGNPCRHVADRRHLRQIHPHGAMPHRAHRRDVRIEHARLAEAPGGSQADSHPVARSALQAIELRTAVDQTAGLNRPLIAERIHRTSVYGIPAQAGSRDGRAVSQLAPVVVLAVSAVVAIIAVAIVSRNYGTTLRSLLADAEVLFATQADDADGTLRRMIVEDLNDALDANAKTLRLKGYLVTSAIALLILSVLLILAHNP